MKWNIPNLEQLNYKGYQIIIKVNEESIFYEGNKISLL